MSTVADETRAEELDRVLEELDLQWEIGDTETVAGMGECCMHPDTATYVSNGMYDDMVEELRKLEPQHDRFTRPGGGKDIGGRTKMVHDPPLRSIGKASHEDLPTQQGQLFDWITDTRKKLDADGYSSDGRVFSVELDDDLSAEYAEGEFYQGFKLDGVALALYYEDGVLVKAGTRPRDGINGQDVTEHVQHVKGVPSKLKKPWTCSVRGEVVCLKSDFEKVQKDLARAGEKLRANERNHTAGAFNNDDMGRVKAARITFIAYGIEGDDDAPYETERDRAVYANKQLGLKYVRVENFNFYDLDKLEKLADELDYRVDGIIVGVNNLEASANLGFHGDKITGNPRGKIAWKFREEQQSAKIKDIVWQTGRTGVMKPVAVFDAVRLADTDVRRATLHNADFIRNLKIEIGTTIIVQKAGNIIPKVVGVKEGQCKGKPDFPKTCDSCNAPADSSGTEVRCTNEKCAARRVRQFNYFLSTLGVLGLGESKLSQLLGGGAVHEFADLFSMDEKDAISAGMSERQALIAVAGIHLIPNADKEKDDDRLRKKIKLATAKKKQIPFWQLFASLGIPTAGKSAGKILWEKYKSFDEIVAAGVEKLADLPDIGEATANVVIDWFDENLDEANAILEYIEPTFPKTGPLSGKKFCLSGSLDGGKKKWQTAIEDQGGTVSGSFSRKLDYLVAGEGSEKKSQQAKDHGVPILDVKGLEKLLG